ncbi:aldehyde dehydrogenase [Dichomitus squalens]|uniref:Aldehyde dehydrogenase n=1 Tax=Dichomitus squalens TaxID=114155 RepID=A0A4Q9PKA8_9APHY|nr:aldehyde dehydrogenase [Dichomitus squalens]TBU54552.1 aldehyde dehydrogenase [Dichomitus squalens]
MSGFSFTDGFANIIDGKKATSPTSADIIDPSTEEVWARVPIATPEQLEDAIAAAERAFPAWSATPWEERQAALNKLADLIDQHAEQVAHLLMKEIGKDRGAAAFELSISTPWLRGVAKQKLEEEVRTEDSGRVSKIRFRPFGVVAGICPFNFPLTLGINKFAQAVLAGNCMILKAPPSAPCLVIKVIELAQSVLPPGVLQVLNGGNDLGQLMVKHPRIMRVSMTGSTGGGKAIMREAGAELKSITLELGGNDPAIVLDDIDVKQVAQVLFLGATHNAGQVCFTIKRIFVHENIYDAVKEELIAIAKEVRIGNPFDPDVNMGPVQNKAQYDRLQSLLTDCKEKGYKIAFRSSPRPTGEKGYYVPLTIIDNPPDESRIAREEQFGPIVPLFKWKDDEEVVRRANGTDFGFSSSVWGKDMDRVQRIADGLYNGMVWVNEWGAVSADHPMGGTKHSGTGVECSKYGLTSWTFVQSFVVRDP